jgi:hypothetical protein
VRDRQRSIQRPRVSDKQEPPFSCRAPTTAFVPASTRRDSRVCVLAGGTKAVVATMNAAIR